MGRTKDFLVGGAVLGECDLRPGGPASARPEPWWADAVVYQVYLRSFRDSDGDGVGDLVGLCEGLGSIAELGCDAIWLNPCYASPQRDHGYDISDYRSIAPDYGTLADFDELVVRAHRLGLRVLMDMVPNHCSDRHPWFVEALSAEPGAPALERFFVRVGRGADGERPPNNWESVFSGSAWTRVAGPDGRPGQWYFHAFDSAQPDFNWRNPEVVAEFTDVLRFWFDRGVDGFRVDVAHGNVKSALMEDWPGAAVGGGHNYAMWDQPEVHDIYRGWRKVADSYVEPKYFVGEAWLPSPESMASYARPDELNQTFAFDLLIQPWNATRMRAAVESGLRIAAAGVRPAWVLSNHDVHRTVTRYGQEQSLDIPSSSDMIAAARRRGPADLELGGRRARAGAALMLALPGSVFLYQGEELGLPEVMDLPDRARQDPIWVRSGGAEPGRDGCRVPLPWTPDGASLGFGPDGGSPPWLPQPECFASHSRQAQASSPGSTLSLYRRLVRRRREVFAGGGGLRWLDSPDRDVLAFTHGRGCCVVNFGSSPFRVPSAWPLGRLVVNTSSDFEGSGFEDGVVPVDSASWFTSAPARTSAQERQTTAPGTRPGKTF
ncbi:MAG: glycoside hydrolase family 13 protein [Bifidobacteriaceae bacterium]|jgi:alpha-glucosidase|nr:glycoside hydrolase family 13 protein [Bifidobacteriaceae bacterium]